MKKFLSQMFNEGSEVSLMRVMALLSLLIGAYLALKGQHESVPTFVYAAFGGKFAQKFIETKDQSPKPD